MHMDIAADPILLRAFERAAASVPELESRLLAHDIGCFMAADLALMDICKSIGMGEETFLETKAKRAQGVFTPMPTGPDPFFGAIAAYDAERHTGAALEKIRLAFHLQLALDCGRSNWSQPHTGDGVISTIKAVAEAQGVQTGKRAFGNHKPVLVTPLSSDLSLVATLYWAGQSPTSPDAGLDWQFCIFDGGIEQARIARALNPPAIYRLSALRGALFGQRFMLWHRSTHQVYVFTATICILMRWFAEGYSDAS